MNWTDDSAMWQALNGNRNTPTTESAIDYIRARLAGRTQAELNGEAAEGTRYRELAARFEAAS
jgi:hypothetical protein